jgi:hypothetical protein
MLKPAEYNLHLIIAGLVLAVDCLIYKCTSISLLIMGVTLLVIAETAGVKKHVEEKKYSSIILLPGVILSCLAIIYPPLALVAIPGYFMLQKYKMKVVDKSER